MNITYQELLTYITQKAQEDPTILQQNVTVYLKFMDEFLPVESISINETSDVLDEGHLYLKVDA